MRFIIFMIPNDYHKAPADFDPDPDEMVAMGQFNESLKNAGVLKSVQGLTPPAAGVRIAFDGKSSGGNPTLKHGPFTETTETVGGYWVLELGSQQDAIEWAKKCPALPGDVLEIRQIAG